MDGSAPKPSIKKRLLTILRLSFALIILAFVAAGLPWQDELSFKRGKESWSVSGEIVGDWKLDQAEFRLGADQVLPPEWPADELPVLGETRDFERDSSRTGSEEYVGFDWSPGMPRVFRELDRKGLALAMALFLVSQAVVTLRWWRLLALAGCHTTWWNVLRLNFLGLFFNQAVPGLTGGDLVKGVFVVREHPERRADALVSVAVDRILGLGGLVVLAIVVILLSGETFQAVRMPLVAVLVVGIMGAVAYANQRVRDVLGLSKIGNRLPFAEKLRSLDRAALYYLEKPLELVVAFGLSIVNHLLLVGGVYVLSRAFGLSGNLVGLWDLLVVVPVANIVSALPLAPGGWGLGELVYRELFVMIGANPVLGVAISVTFRLCFVALGLVGGVYLLSPARKAQLRELEAASGSADVPDENP